MLRLAVAGCVGKMGKALVQAISLSEDVRLTAGTVSPRHAAMAQDIGLLSGLPLMHLKPVDDLAKIVDSFDVLIDFTSPLATLQHIRICEKFAKKIIIGTTGFSAEQKSLIKDASRDIPIVFSPNMSIGLNVCLELLKQAAKTLGDSVDIEIIEAHHREKRDAPSGTALQMAEVICNTLSRNLNERAIYGRYGADKERDRHTIGFSSIRGGDIVGDHTVLFAAEGERIEITHRASNRVNFANGAILAAKWLTDQKPGLYTMSDVLFPKKLDK